MKRLCAAGVALGLILAAQAGPAHAHPRHNAGAIAYVTDRDSTAEVPTDEVYLIEPQSRRLHRMTYDLAGIERWPTISPDGRSLAWVRLVEDEAGVTLPELTKIYRCDLRSRAGAWSCQHPREVVGPVQENAIAWSADSRAILYSEPVTADGDADLYSVDLRSHRTTNLTHEAVVDETFVQNSQPTVSPDGTSFIYSRGSGAAGADLYRRNIDGTNPVQLTAAPRNDIAADYSPDGQRLVFHSNRDGDADIYIMRATVEGPDNPAVNLTDGLPATGDLKSQERAPSFSTDGRHIAFWRFTNLGNGPDAGFTDGEIYSMRTDGSHVRNLTDNNPADAATTLTIGDIQPDWGPSPARRVRR